MPITRPDGRRAPARTIRVRPLAMRNSAAMSEFGPNNPISAVEEVSSEAGRVARPATLPGVAPGRELLAMMCSMHPAVAGIRWNGRLRAAALAPGRTGGKGDQGSVGTLRHLCRCDARTFSDLPLVSLSSPRPAQ